jgi:hypothetical protein
MRFRAAVGLQADEAWVHAVAANPLAQIGSETYEIPLLPTELAYLRSRSGLNEEKLAFGQTYGATFPDGFAGAAIDSSAGDRLVLLYTIGVAAHQNRLGLMPPQLRTDVRPATWTLVELQGFQSRIASNTAIDPRIKVYGADIDILANRVIVNFSAPTKELGDVLLSSYGSTGWLVPRWFGPTEPVDRPVGILLLTVVTAQGVPVPNLQCRYTSLDPTAPGDGGADTSDAGECRFTSIVAGRYRIDILEPDERVDRILKSMEVVVAAGTTNDVRIVVDWP